MTTDAKATPAMISAGVQELDRQLLDVYGRKINMREIIAAVWDAMCRAAPSPDKEK